MNRSSILAFLVLVPLSLLQAQKQAAGSVAGPALAADGRAIRAMTVLEYAHTLILPASSTTIVPGNSTKFIMHAPWATSALAFTCACPAGITASFERTNAPLYDMYAMTVNVLSGTAAGAQH
jgi:hypothetical protein